MGGKEGLCQSTVSSPLTFLCRCDSMWVENTKGGGKLANMHAWEVRGGMKAQE